MKMQDAAPVNCGHKDYDPRRQCRECLLIRLEIGLKRAETDREYYIKRMGEVERELRSEGLLTP